MRSAKEIEAAWREAWKSIRPGNAVKEAERSLDHLEKTAKRAANGVESGFGGVVRNFLKGGIWGVAANAFNRLLSSMKSGIVNVFKSAFDFETMTTQFKTLIGNIDEAKRHMADLKELGDTPPFSLDQFAAASRSLMVMTDGVLGYRKSLELLGDAAAATGQPLDGMAQSVGYLYAAIRDGQPLSRATMQLRRMGVLTPEVAQKLQDMQDAGESGVAIWDAVEAALGRYNGAMKETKATGNGLIGAIKSQWNNIVRAFGDALQNDAKSGLNDVLESAKKLQEDGSIQTWATSAASAVGIVAKAVGSVVSGISKVIKHLKAGRDAWREFFGGEKAEEDAEETFSLDREEDVNAYTRKRYFTGSNGSERVEVVEDAEKKKEHEKRMREQEEEDRKREALEEGDRKRAEKAAEEKAKKEAEEAKKAAEKKAEAEKKAAEKAAAERARLAKQQEQEDKRREAEETQRKIRNHQQLLAAERAEESKMRSAASAAESKLQQAWGWYRDKDSMAAQIAEEKADAQARKQFEKDFERLKDRRRDWRTAENLSVDDEAVRRVALAREEKEAAERHLAEIEKNTADLAAKLDELLQAKG